MKKGVLLASMLAATSLAQARGNPAGIPAPDGQLGAEGLNLLFDKSRAAGRNEATPLLVLGGIAGQFEAPAATARLVLASYGESTPCANLSDKAARLRRAATQCDAAVANGSMSSCQVELATFNLPGVPRFMSPGAARALAERLTSQSYSGDEQGCHDAGGEGRVPEPPAPPPAPPQPAEEPPAPQDPPHEEAPTPRQADPPTASDEDDTESLKRQDAEEARMFKDLHDALDTSANPQIKDALVEFAAGGLLAKITYGPEAPWTKALQNHGHLVGVRRRIRQAFRRGPVEDGPHPDPFALKKLTMGENLLLMLRDAVAPFVGWNMAYTTGSMNFYWKKGSVDEAHRRVTIEFTARDTLSINSLTHLPRDLWKGLPNDLFSHVGPLHNVDIEWHWTEVISY